MSETWPYFLLTLGYASSMLALIWFLIVWSEKR